VLFFSGHPFLPAWCGPCSPRPEVSCRHDLFPSPSLQPSAVPLIQPSYPEASRRPHFSNGFHRLFQLGLFLLKHRGGLLKESPGPNNVSEQIVSSGQSRGDRRIILLSLARMETRQMVPIPSLFFGHFFAVPHHFSSGPHPFQNVLLVGVRADERGHQHGLGRPFRAGTSSPVHGVVLGTGHLLTRRLYYKAPSATTTFKRRKPPCERLNQRALLKVIPPYCVLLRLVPYTRRAQHVSRNL